MFLGLSAVRAIVIMFLSAANISKYFFGRRRQDKVSTCDPRIATGVVEMSEFHIKSFSPEELGSFHEEFFQFFKPFLESFNFGNFEYDLYYLDPRIKDKKIDHIDFLLFDSETEKHKDVIKTPASHPLTILISKLSKSDLVHDFISDSILQFKHEYVKNEILIAITKDFSKFYIECIGENKIV